MSKAKRTLTGKKAKKSKTKVSKSTDAFWALVLLFLEDMGAYKSSIHLGDHERVRNDLLDQGYYKGSEQRLAKTTNLRLQTCLDDINLINRLCVRYEIDPVQNPNELVNLLLEADCREFYKNRAAAYHKEDKKVSFDALKEEYRQHLAQKKQKAEQKRQEAEERNRAELDALIARDTKPVSPTNPELEAIMAQTREVCLKSTSKETNQQMKLFDV